MERLELQPLTCATRHSPKPTVGCHGGEVNDAGDGDDQEADDDGGDRHVERHPAQPPGAVVVSPRVAVPGLGEGEKTPLRVSPGIWTLDSVGSFNKSSWSVSEKIWENLFFCWPEAARPDCNVADCS